MRFGRYGREAGERPTATAAATTATAAAAATAVAAGDRRIKLPLYIAAWLCYTLLKHWRGWSDKSSASGASRRWAKRPGRKKRALLPPISLGKLLIANGGGHK
jgi:hypothetical protein